MNYEIRVIVIYNSEGHFWSSVLNYAMKRNRRPMLKKSIDYKECSRNQPRNASEFEELLDKPGAALLITAL